LRCLTGIDVVVGVEGLTAGRCMLGHERDLEDLKREPDACRADDVTDMMPLIPLFLMNYNQDLNHSESEMFLIV